MHAIVFLPALIAIKMKSVPVIFMVRDQNLKKIQNILHSEFGCKTEAYMFDKIWTYCNVTCSVGCKKLSSYEEQNLAVKVTKK